MPSELDRTQDFFQALLMSATKERHDRLAQADSRKELVDEKRRLQLGKHGALFRAQISIVNNGK